MAVDTEAKRLSMLGFSCEVIDPGLIAPDATVSQGDRQSLIWGYSGIAWEEVNITWYVYLRSRYRSTVEFTTNYPHTVSLRARFRNTASFTSEFY